MVIPLSCLKRGQQASVVWVASSAPRKHRLALIGFQEGARVVCLMEGKGGMGAYWVGGTAFGIRGGDAREVFVRVGG